MFVYAMMYEIVFLKKTDDSYRGRTENDSKFHCSLQKMGSAPFKEA